MDREVTVTFPAWMVYVMVTIWCIKWLMEARLSYYKYQLEMKKRRASHYD